MVGPIRVLVVDDSALMRRLVSDMLAADPEIAVVGTARDGDDALAKIPALKPDVVTLDIEMPGRDGLSTLTEIMRRHPLPVVMLSSLTQLGAEATFRALSLGAVEFVGKPSGAISMDVADVAAETIAKVRAAAASRPNSLVAAPTPSARPAPRPRRAGGLGALVIGASTGGPNALATLLPMIPANLGVPIVVVQHMGPAFTRLLAARLSDGGDLPVREAEDGDRLHAGTALLAPGGRHLEFDAGGIVRLSDGPTVNAVRPSIDVTMHSLVALYGARTVGVLLTGMGRDGASGLKAIRDAGGRTIAEAESTSVVFGMPRVAAEIGAAERVLPLPKIADALLDLIAPPAFSSFLESFPAA